ncbi:MAG TPA: hypothetical protein VN869_04320, partial [Steroidobacteraceae bacterium]|nr:hypothetical protein [Steroidobacteraceae bacterium]
ALGAFAPGAKAQVDINATISGEVRPGVYGRVVVGEQRPALVYEQPVIVERVEAPPEPVYLHVPPEHARNWHRYCHEYHACNRPVYFVRSAEYEPGYRGHEEHERRHHDDEHGDRDRGEHDHGDHEHGDRDH